MHELLLVVLLFLGLTQLSVQIRPVRRFRCRE